MKLKPSPLELKDLSVIQCEYRFIPIERSTQLSDLAGKYTYDIDFAIKGNDDTFITIFTKISINNIRDTKPLPGYSIFAECAGVFSLSEKNISAEDRQALIVNSGVSIVINYLRNFVANMTSNFPAGKLWIPSLNLRELILSKSQQRDDSKKTIRKAGKKKP